jgi:hypothetical protein
LSKFFIDCEFLEGKQSKRFLGIHYGYSKPTIDLISIGLISDNDETYYAISKDFNIREAWERNDGTNKTPNHWIRYNVLKPIFNELQLLESNNSTFNYLQFKYLVNKYGKSLETISKEIIDFCNDNEKNIEYKSAIDMNFYNNESFYKNALSRLKRGDVSSVKMKKQLVGTCDIKFYAYYADYDWVTFCWIFGKMINLPKNFPKYCIDIKQIIYDLKLNYEIDDHPDYPIEHHPHHALWDAKWDKELYELTTKL